MTRLFTVSIDQLASHKAAVADLAANVTEPNVFFEPWMLEPALKWLAKGRLSVALFEEDDGRLSGLFPIDERRHFRGLPVPFARTWQHMHCFLGTPLIRAGRETAFLEALLGFLGHSDCPWALLQLSSIDNNGALARALEPLLHKSGHPWVAGPVVERALLEVKGSAQSCLESAITKRKLRELRRQHRRLSELGKLEFQFLAPDDDPDPWIEDFLALEANGWKGQTGTAMAADVAQSGFFREMMRGAHAEQQLMVLRMALDGRTVSSQVNFRSGRGGFAFKVAFDEDFARHSPGVLLELENIRYLHENEKLKWMDSCADPGQRMIEKLWTGRRRLQNYFLGTRHPLSKSLLTGMKTAYWLRTGSETKPHHDPPSPTGIQVP